MSEIEQRIDRCDALDVLEEAVLLRRTVSLVLDDGERETGLVIDVVTERGADVVHLEDGTQVDVTRIVAIGRG